MNDSKIAINAYEWMDKDEIMIIGKHNTILMNLKTGSVKSLSMEELKRRLAECEETNMDDETGKNNGNDNPNLTC